MQQARNLQFLDALNRRHLASHPGETDLEARIRTYELAASMQILATGTYRVTLVKSKDSKENGTDEASVDPTGCFTSPYAVG